MAANAGLTVKERLALLQNCSGTNKPTGEPTRNIPGVKPTSPNETKQPPGISGFKPVTPTKPAVTDNKTITTNKPALASKPGTAAKPLIAKTGTDEAAKTNGTDKSQFPKVRPVGAQPGKVAPSATNKPNPSATETGGEGEETSSTKSPKSNSSQSTAGGSDSSSSPEMREKTCIVTPIKPVSVQERLAALKQKASGGDSMDPHHKENSKGSTSPKSPITLNNKSPSLSSPSSSGVLKPVNGPKSDSTGSKPDMAGIRPSDIAKSLNQAADRVLRNKAATETSGEENKKSTYLFQRHSDGKKFRKLDVALVTASEPAPVKPNKISNVDLTSFIKAYATAKEEKMNKDAGKTDFPTEGEDGQVDEMYVEAESTSVPIRGRRGSAKRASTARVSQIPEFTEEEEEEELYTDGTSGSQPPPSEPDETYDDCEPALEPQPQRQEEQQLEEPDEIYEPLDEDLPTEPQTLKPEPESHPPPVPSPNLPDNRKNKDKETKEKEEAAKKRDQAKEEKERKKKEEELKKMRRKFGLNDSDEKLGDGVVKNNASGGVFSKDLGVAKGETVAILRMDGNPAGKWLVQNEHGKIGFVSSNNIEVSTPTIRNLMSGVKTEAETPEAPDELYEFLPEDPSDEIYEEL